jgi:hypothetical protein
VLSIILFDIIVITIVLIITKPGRLLCGVYDHTPRPTCILYRHKPASEMTIQCSVTWHRTHKAQKSWGKPANRQGQKCLLINRRRPDRERPTSVSRKCRKPAQHHLEFASAKGSRSWRHQICLQRRRLPPLLFPRLQQLDLPGKTQSMI